MGFFERILAAGRKLDHAVYTKTGLDRVVGAVKPKIPFGLRKIAARYGPFVGTALVILLFALALSGGGGGSRITTADKESDKTAAGDPGGIVPSADPAATAAAVEAAAKAAAAAKAQGQVFKGQVASLATQNVCGKNGILATGPTQYFYAPQCVPKWADNADNSGETSRGVYRDKIRVAVYITTDPQTIATTEAVDACGDPACWEDYNKVYIDWFKKYYERYGRDVEAVYVRGSGREDQTELARQDADRVINLNPPVFASLGGPLQAGTVYAERLANAGILCFCTASLPEGKYKDNAPYIWAPLMSSTQAYIHRAEYIAKRLCAPSVVNTQNPGTDVCTRKAEYAGAWGGGIAEPKLREMNRTFGLIWYDNQQHDYPLGVQFFKEELARYGIKIKQEVTYEGIEQCQVLSGNMIHQLNGQVTSVIFAGDPVCPINLTKAAEGAQVKWEWIVTGSYLTDTNNLARLYDQSQWSRAFGVSMLSPDIKDQNEAWHKMYMETKGNRRDPQVDTPIYLANPTLFFAGVHLAGPKLTPQTFRDGMFKMIQMGGSVTIPRRSFGPKTAGLGSEPLVDYTANEDMTELWYDPNQIGPDGKKGAYWYPAEGKRYQWGEWPATTPSPFDKNSATFGFETPPDY